MRKLRLDLDDLQVESFAVTPVVVKKLGTVRGQAMVTYACTIGYDGCAVPTLNVYTCHLTDNETEGGNTCWEMNCNPSGRIADSCQTEAACASFTLCTMEHCD